MATNRVTRVILSVVVDVYTTTYIFFTYIYKDIQKEFICGIYMLCIYTYLYTIFETTLSKSCHFAAVWIPGSNGPGCGLVGAEPWSVGFKPG